MPRPAAPKRDRFDMRVTPTVRRLLLLAAQAAGESLTDFVLRAAVARARVHIFDLPLINEAEREMGVRRP